MADNPFGSDPFEIVFKDLLKVMSSQGQLASSVAEQFATSIAAEGDGSHNPEPLVRMKLESLFELADRELANESILADLLPRNVSVEVVSPVDFARKSLADFSELLGRAEEVAKAASPTDMTAAAESIEIAGLPLAQMGSMMGPVMTGLNAGSCIGHLANESLGSYDVPLIRSDGRIQVVAANLKSFAEEWSLDYDEVALWLCLSQLSIHTILSRPSIKARIERLVDDHFGASIQFTEMLNKKLSEIDMSDPSALQRLASNPNELMGIQLSSTQEAQLRDARGFFAVVVGLADYATSTAARKLMGSFEPIAEALRRRRLEIREGEELFKKLFGLGFDSVTFELGHKFVFGVLERNAENELGKILIDDQMFPTPNEIDAPGLWLARTGASS